MKWLKIAKFGYYLVSVLFYAVAACYIFRDEIDLNLSVAMAGVILILYGANKILAYLSKDLYCLAFQYDLACGVLVIVIGAFALVFRSRVEEYLFIGSGLLILLDSLLCIQTALDARRFGLEAWKGILVLSAAAGVLGAASVAADTQLSAGLALLGEGAMRHYITYTTVRPFKSAE